MKNDYNHIFFISNGSNHLSEVLLILYIEGVFHYVSDTDTILQRTHDYI
jgi:hypothetical protein